ncbi:hypothetical protein RI367_006056 [Sorochytrium milnesiophthora]
MDFDWPADPRLLGAVVAAVVAGATYALYGFLQRNDRSKKALRSLKKLFKVSMDKFVDAEINLRSLETGEWEECKQEVARIQSTLPNDPSFASECKQLERRLQYLEDKILRVLESLDNVKPNGIYVEYFFSTAGDKDQAAALDTDELEQLVLRQLTPSDASHIKDNISMLKRRKKKTSSSILALLKEVDTTLATVRSLSTSLSS